MTGPQLEKRLAERKEEGREANGVVVANMLLPCSLSIRRIVMLRA